MSLSTAACLFVLAATASGVSQSEKGQGHLTIKVDIRLTFMSDYWGQDVRMLPEELWHLNTVTKWVFPADAAAVSGFLIGPRWADHGAEMPQQNKACLMQFEAMFDV